MDRVEDCFVKFFLSQAPEIEPDTIQALIDQGYRTKIAILAMDLALDLSQIPNIPLAQKSIIRKYIAFLQENSPFKLQIADDDVQPVRKQQALKPNKKRKFEWLAGDSDEEEDYPSSSKNKAVSSSRKSVAPSIVSPRMVSPASVASSMNVSPIKARRLSINFDDSTVSTSRADVEMANVKEEKHKVPAKPRGRPSRVTKKEPVRTASQIRYDNMKKLQSNGSNQEEEEEESEEEIVNQPPVRMEPTRKSSSRASVAPNVVVKAEPAQPVKYMTNAEKAMLARIEDRKLKENAKKRGRGKK